MLPSFQPSSSHQIASKPRPAGLAVIITGAALSGTTISTAALIAATKGIAMTTLQKTAITAAIAVAVGTGIYEGRRSCSRAVR